LRRRDIGPLRDTGRLRDTAPARPAPLSHDTSAYIRMMLFLLDFSSDS
jgi:hypothetical protein